MLAGNKKGPECFSGPVAARELGERERPGPLQAGTNDDPHQCVIFRCEHPQACHHLLWAHRTRSFVASNIIPATSMGVKQTRDDA